MFPIEANLLNPTRRKPSAQNRNEVANAPLCVINAQSPLGVGRNIEVGVKSAVRIDHSNAVGPDKPDIEADRSVWTSSFSRCFASLVPSSPNPADMHTAADTSLNRLFL